MTDSDKTTTQALGAERVDRLIDELFSAVRKETAEGWRSSVTFLVCGDLLAELPAIDDHNTRIVSGLLDAALEYERERTAPIRGRNRPTAALVAKGAEYLRQEAAYLAAATQGVTNGRDQGVRAEAH